jgi:hypothetical protein
LLRHRGRGAARHKKGWVSGLLQTLTSINFLKSSHGPVITSERATNDTPIQAQLRAPVLPFEAGGARLRGATALSIRDAASRVCGSSMFV